MNDLGYTLLWQEKESLRAKLAAAQRELNAANGAGENWRRHAAKAEAELAAARAALEEIENLSESGNASSYRDFRDIARAALAATKEDKP